MKSREGSLRYVKSGQGMSDPGHLTQQHRKGKFQSLNNKQ